MAESHLSRPPGRGNPIPLPGFEGKRRTPLLAIRAFCLACMGGSAPLVAECAASTCPFHGQRMGTIEPGADRRLVRVIKSYCGQCLSAEDQAACTAGKGYLDLSPCPCWPYRTGRNPSRAGMGNRGNLGVFGKPHSQPVSRSRIDEATPAHSFPHPEQESRPVQGQEAYHG